MKFSNSLTGLDYWSDWVIKKLLASWPYLFFILLIFAVFHQTFLFGRLPFPGDLILSEYAPWRQSSYFGFPPGAIPTKAQYFDVIRELYPWKSLAIDELKSGRWPLWNPYNFSGTPLLANFQSAVFYPGNIFYFMFPQPIAWSILIILQPLLCLIFTFRFARTLKLSRLPSSLVAVLFTFSSFQTVWLEFNTVGHTLLWLPLLLTFIEYLLQSQTSIRVYLIWIFSLFSTLTAGHPQDAIYVILFTFIYLFWRTAISHHPQPTKFKLLAGVILLSLLTIGLASVQLVTTLELFLSSARSAHNPQYIVSNLLIQPIQLVMFFIQDFFGNPATRNYLLNDTYVLKAVSIGSIGLVLFLLGLFSVKNKPKHFTFFSWISVITFLLLIRHPLTEIFYRLPIPILSTGTPTRIASIFTFCASLLAGYGAEKIISRELPFKKFIAIFFLLLSFSWLYFLFSHSNFRPLLLTSLIYIAATIFLFLNHKIRFSYFGILLLIAFELSYSYLKFNSFVPIEYFFPSNPVFSFLQSQNSIDRFWGYGTGRIEANFATQYRLFSPDGTDPLNLKFYNDFLNSTSRGDVVIPPGYGPTDLPQDLVRLRYLDLIGVKYILDRFENPKDDTTFSGDRFKKIWELEGWVIYENVLAAPRYFLTANIIKSNFQNSKQILFSPEFNPQAQVVISEDNQLPDSLLPDPDSQVKLVSYLPTQIMFQTTSRSSQLLYLSDVKAPGWFATIDDSPTPIIAANQIFRSVIVPAGNHTITFSYFPTSFKLGLIISISSLISLIVIFAAKRTLLDHTSF